MFPITSARVALRPFADGDEDVMLAIYGDAEVMRHVGAGNPASAAEVTAMIADYRRHQDEHGFAFWAVLDRAQGTVIGDAGFEARGVGAELGYTLARAWWGRGLATEVGALCVRTAFDVLELPWLTAVVDPANPASGRVLEKLGFLPDGERRAYGRAHRGYVLRRRPDRPAPVSPRPPGRR